MTLVQKAKRQIRGFQKPYPGRIHKAIEEEGIPVIGRTNYEFFFGIIGSHVNNYYFLESGLDPDKLAIELGFRKYRSIKTGSLGGSGLHEEGITKFLREEGQKGVVAYSAYRPGSAEILNMRMWPSIDAVTWVIPIDLNVTPRENVENFIPNIVNGETVWVSGKKVRENYWRAKHPKSRLLQPD